MFLKLVNLTDLINVYGAIRFGVLAMILRYSQQSCCCKSVLVAVAVQRHGHAYDHGMPSPRLNMRENVCLEPYSSQQVWLHFLHLFLRNHERAPEKT